MQCASCPLEMVISYLPDRTPHVSPSRLPRTCAHLGSCSIFSFETHLLMMLQLTISMNSALLICITLRGAGPCELQYFAQDHGARTAPSRKSCMLTRPQSCLGAFTLSDLLVLDSLSYIIIYALLHRPHSCPHAHVSS